MSSILKHLPIPEDDEIAFVGTEYVRLKGSEIIIWASLSLKKTTIWDPAIPCFPAILDTGNNHYFCIQEQHLRRWAGVRPETLGILGRVRQADERLPLRPACIWLHRNVPGKRERLEGLRPQRLELPRGIAVYPKNDDNFPRLPLIGMRALLANGLYLSVNGQKQFAHLRTPDWRTRLLSWLS